MWPESSHLSHREMTGKHPDSQRRLKPPTLTPPPHTGNSPRHSSSASPGKGPPRESERIFHSLGFNSESFIHWVLTPWEGHHHIPLELAVCLPVSQLSSDQVLLLCCKSEKFQTKQTWIMIYLLTHVTKRPSCRPDRRSGWIRALAMWRGPISLLP